MYLALDSGSLTSALACNSNYQTWTNQQGSNENKPINCVTWFEAMIFCAWDGGFLPTDAEWNYAAAGGSEQRTYPWSMPASSTTIDTSYADYCSSNTCCSGNCISIQNVGADSPKGDGKWGQADLAGNLDEWGLDWYPGWAIPCTDCAYLSPTSDRIIRSGSFADSVASSMRTTLRVGGSPTTRYFTNGFRCARPK
jgi:formylglycine-generating enzyme required for sulfatase activity